MVQSANIFGAFLNGVADGASSSAARTVDVFSTALSTALKSGGSESQDRGGPQAGMDVIPTLLRAIAHSHASDIVAIVKATGLRFDVAAAALQSAQTTGLLRSSIGPDDTVSYEVTSLGQKMV